MPISIVDIDECEAAECQNGAACTHGVNSYECTCEAGYEGVYCETSKYVCTY